MQSTKAVKASLARQKGTHLHFELQFGDGGIALLQLLLHSGDAAARLLYLPAAAP